VPELPAAAPHEKTGTIPVSGENVWYRICGADRPGIPLLVLHGGPGAPHDYLTPLAALADTRPVVFYDQLGCGNSDKVAGTSLLTVERFARELGEVRAALGLERVFILGQSWGSMLAVDYLLTQKPAGVQGLVLSGPCLSASRWGADQRAYVDQLPEPSRRAILDNEASGTYAAPEYQDALMEYYRLHVCRLDPWPDLLMRTFDRLAADVYGYMWGPSEFTITGTLGAYDRVTRLKEITVPVLFTCGEYDEATPTATAWYRDNLPGSGMIVFEGASHEHHLEKREEYIAVVRAFLDRAGRRG